MVTFLLHLLLLRPWQIMTLQNAIRAGMPRIIFEDSDIAVSAQFAVFITMNPGYAGRTELPDNLKVCHQEGPVYRCLRLFSKACAVGCYRQDFRVLFTTGSPACKCWCRMQWAALIPRFVSWQLVFSF